MNTQLQQARKNARLTQKQLAKIAGISNRSYQRLESGEQSSQLKSAILIAQALNSTVEELFNNSAEPMC